MPSLNNFLLQALLEKGQLCLQNNSMDANNFVAMMNELALEVFLENVSKADLLNEAQMKHIKRYSTINKPELIKILWNSAVFIDKTNLKRIKTVNSKRTLGIAVGGNRHIDCCFGKMRLRGIRQERRKVRVLSTSSLI